ncbi:MAG: gas vesicle protein [Pseudomonadota bacterium]
MTSPFKNSHLDEESRLVEVLDRLLDRGVVVVAHASLSIADIDLVDLEARIRLTRRGHAEARPVAGQAESEGLVP